MGSSCISNQKDSLSEDISIIQINNEENDIQNINQTIKTNFQQVKLLKESLDEGIQISNIETIIIYPSCGSEGKLGTQITIISKRVPDSPISSLKLINKKGILKNKQEMNTNQQIDESIFFPSSNRTKSKNIKR